MPLDRFPTVLPYVAVACGVAGVAGVLLRAPQRSSLLWIGLLFAFTLLGSGGVAGMLDNPIAARLSGGLFQAGLAAVALTSVFVAWHAATLVRIAHTHRAESERAQRALQQASGDNFRLEDELREVRVKLSRLIEQQAEISPSGLTRLRDQLAAMETRERHARGHRAVFEQALEGMARLERETLRLAEVNDALVRLSGRSREVVEEMTLLELVSADGRPIGKADMQRAARDRRPIAVALDHPDGHRVLGELTISVIGSEEDAELLAVIRDVSHRETIEREMEQQTEFVRDRERRLQDTHRATVDRLRQLEHQCVGLQQILEAKDQFLAGLAHELRTPLTSIRSFAEILLEPRPISDETQGEFLAIIVKESERLSRLVGEVLDLSRLESGELRLLLCDFDARDVVRDAMDAVHGEALRRGVEFEATLGDDPVPLFADRDRIQQVLVNLLGNAVKFSPDGSTVRVQFEAATTAGFVRMSVRDEGPGVAAEDLTRIFDRYYQGRTSRTRIEGTGLGLAICHEIAQAHRARVWAEGGSGAGATFVFELPGAVKSRARLSRSAETGAGPVVEVRSPRPVPPLQLIGRAAEPTPDERPRVRTDPGMLPPLGG